VLVGVGVADQRCDDPREALEPLELMTAALERAADDAGSRQLLAQADSVRVPRGFWDYSDPGRLVADRIGAKNARTILAEIGVLQQTLLSQACADIAAGRERVALFTGGEARYRNLRAKQAGVELANTPQTGVEPDLVLRPAEPLWDDLEASHGLMMPVHFFAVIENALRFHDGLGIEEHQSRIAELWAAMSRVAAANPHAWRRTPVTPEQLRDLSGRNRMIAFPYARLHNSDWNVDQAAGLVLCSVETARRHAIPEERWVFPLSAAESNHMLPVSARDELHRSPGAAIAGARALELAELGAGDLTHLELYSCFPAAVQIFARELDLDLDRPVTVTGGMTFAGGPLNNYVLQATARMAEVLRADPGSAGLVSSVSGFLTKQGFGIWSTLPPAKGFRGADCSDEVAATSRTRELVGDHEGSATVAGYTVIYLGADPFRGIAICDLPDGRRSVAASDDPGLAAAMTREEFCGRRVELGAGGKLISIAGS
jgi:acetyl-CoA C-acetyltransferase